MNIKYNWIKNIASQYVTSTKKNISFSDICDTEECLKEALGILSSMDNSINPCDDFLSFSCGNYLKRDNEFGTPSHISYSKFIMDNQINSLIIDTDPLGEWELLVEQRKFYQSCR